MEDSNDPFTDLHADRPCGCHEASPADPFETGDEVSPAGGLEAALAAIEAESGAEDPTIAELEEALAELEGLGSAGGAGLEDLIRLAERHPGLKVTLSF